MDNGEYRKNYLRGNIYQVTNFKQYHIKASRSNYTEHTSQHTSSATIIYKNHDVPVFCLLLLLGNKQQLTVLYNETETQSWLLNQLLTFKLSVRLASNRATCSR